jgi:hypothetical protein
MCPRNHRAAVILIIQLICSIGVLIAAVAGLVTLNRLVPHRRDDLTPFQLWFSGWRFYTRSSFKPSGHAIQTQFFVMVGVMAVLMVVRSLLSLLA